MKTRHEGLSPAFDLSPWSYFLDFLLVPIAVAGLLWAESRNEQGWLAVAILVIAGMTAWSFSEYWIHRLIFHGRTPFEPMHQMHHALPKDMIGIASWGTFSTFGAIWLVAGGAFTAGFMFGYLSYCSIHVRFHHHGPDARLNRYVAFMNRHHVAHHRGGKGNFGVTSPIWDFVFGTYRPTR